MFSGFHDDRFGWIFCGLSTSRADVVLFVNWCSDWLDKMHTHKIELLFFFRIRLAGGWRWNCRCGCIGTNTHHIRRVEYSVSIQLHKMIENQHHSIYRVRSWSTYNTSFCAMTAIDIRTTMNNVQRTDRMVLMIIFIEIKLILNRNVSSFFFFKFTQKSNKILKHRQTRHGNRNQLTHTEWLTLDDTDSTQFI